MGTPQKQLAHGLAVAFLAGDWTPAALRDQARIALGEGRLPAWVGTLIREVIEIHPRPPVDAPRELAQLIQVLPAWTTLRPRTRPRQVSSWHPTPTEMRHAPWPVTRLDDVGALARLLDVSPAELAWFADVRGQERTADPALCHYRISVRRKAGGSVRVLEAPKPRLREIQRRLLRHVIAPIPAHPAAHGCIARRSVTTALAQHTARRTVLRCDLESFFTCVSAARVYGVLRSAGLPEAVAHTVTGLTTTVTAHRAWAAVPRPPAEPALSAHWRSGRRLAAPHLPQGAPTSPALANLVAFALDRRLTGLAESLELRYTRYVDDLIFSGDALRARKVSGAVGRIAADEGFRLAAGKTITLSAARRQQLLGAVVNDHVAAPRREVDRLRAIVHNCVTHGWESQARGQSAHEFRAALTGRIAWVHGLDPRRGALLAERAAAISWP